MDDKVQAQLNRIINMMIDAEQAKGNKLIIYTYRREGTIENGTIYTGAKQTDLRDYDLLMFKHYFTQDIFNSLNGTNE